MSGMANILLAGVPNYPVVTAFNTDAGASPLVINRPGAASGDFQMFFGASPTAGATWTGGTGYTEILDNAGQNSMRMATRLTSGDAATASFTHTAGNALGLLAAFSQGTLGNVGTVGEAAAGFFVDAPGITVPDRGILLAFLYASNLSEFVQDGAGGGSTFWNEMNFNDGVEAISVLWKPVWPGATGTIKFVPTIGTPDMSAVLVSVSGG